MNWGVQGTSEGRKIRLNKSNLITIVKARAMTTGDGLRHSHHQQQTIKQEHEFPLVIKSQRKEKVDHKP